MAGAYGRLTTARMRAGSLATDMEAGHARSRAPSGRPRSASPAPDLNGRTARPPSGRARRYELISAVRWPPDAVIAGHLLGRHQHAPGAAGACGAVRRGDRQG